MALSQFDIAATFPTATLGTLILVACNWSNRKSLGILHRWRAGHAMRRLELDAVLAARAKMPIGRVPENQGRNCMGRSPSLDLEI